MHKNDLQNLQFIYSQIKESDDQELLQKIEKIENEIQEIKNDVTNNAIEINNGLVRLINIEKEVQLIIENVNNNSNRIDDETKRIDTILIAINDLKNEIIDLENKIKNAKLDNITKWINELEALGLNPDKLGRQYNYYLDLQDVKQLFTDTTGMLENEDDPYDLGMLEFESTALNDILLQGDKLLANGFRFKTKELPWDTNRRIQGGMLQIDIKSSKDTNNQENVIYLNMNTVVQITIKEDMMNGKYIYTVESRPEVSNEGTQYIGIIDMDNVKNTRNNYVFTNQDVHILNFEYDNSNDVYLIRGIQLNLDITEQKSNVSYTYYELFKLDGTLFNDFILNLPFGISVNTTLNRSTDINLNTYSQIFRGYSILRLGDLIDVIYDTTENELEENKLFGLYGISSIVSISKLADAVKGTVHATNVRYTNITSWVDNLYAYPEQVNDFEFGPGNIYRNVIPYGDNYPINQLYRSTYIYELSGRDTKPMPMRCDATQWVVKEQKRRISKPWIKLQPNQLQNMRYANPSGGKLLTEYNIPNARLNVVKGTINKVQEDDATESLSVEYHIERQITTLIEEKVHGPVTIVVRDVDYGTYRIIDCDNDRMGLLASGALISEYAENIDTYGYVVIAKNPSQEDFNWIRKPGNQIDVIFGVVIEAQVDYDDVIIIDQGNGTGQGVINNYTFGIEYQKNYEPVKKTTPVLHQNKLVFGTYEKPCYYGTIESTSNEKCIIVSGRVFRMKSKSITKDPVKPVCTQAGQTDGNDWLTTCTPRYYCNKGASQGGDAIKFEIRPLTYYVITRIGTDDPGDGTPEAVDMIPGNRDSKKPLLYYSNYEQTFDYMMYDGEGSNYIKNGYFSFSTKADYGWHQCPDDAGYGYYRWGPRWRSSRVDPLKNTSTNDLVITISLDSRMTPFMYKMDENSPDQFVTRVIPSKIIGVDTSTKLGPWKLLEDYKEEMPEYMNYWSWKWNIKPGNDIVDGTKPLTLITYKTDQYKIIKVDLSVENEIVLPSRIITQNELSEDSVRQWNAIDLVRQYTTYLKALVDNQEQRIQWVEQAVQIINERLNVIVEQLSPKQNPFGISKLITNFLGSAIGIFFPLTGLVFQIATALIDTVEHIENEDLLYSSLDIVLVLLLTSLGIKKFANRIEDKYGVGAFDQAVDYTVIKLKNSFLKLGQTTKAQFSKIGNSLTKLRWKSPGYNPLGSSGKYTINSRPRDKYYSFWTRTTDIKYTKLVNEPEIEVTTVLHSPATNRGGKVVNWLKARDMDWKNILDKTIKNGRVSNPVFRSALKHKVLGKNGDATVVKLGNEGWFIYKINGKIRKYPIDVDSKVSDFTLISDNTMTMNDWIELMHLYSGLGRNSAIASLDSELMDALILSARRPVRPNNVMIHSYNINIQIEEKQYSILEENSENLIVNLPSVSYSDIIKMLDVGIQSRICTTNVISALLSPDSGDS